MKRLCRLALAIVLSLGAARAWAADVYTFDKAHTDVSFQIRHFVTKVRGRFTDFEGSVTMDRQKPASSSVEFTVKAASINTGNEKRDADLRSPHFFDVEKYPEIRFKSSRIAPKGQDMYDVTGTLSMHGVDKEITLPVHFLGAVAFGGGEKAGFELETTIHRKDFGVSWNHVLDNGGLMLGEDVAVSINVEANKSKPEASEAR